MKTPRGRFAFVILPVIAIGTVLTCCEQRLSRHHEVSLEFGKDRAEYVEVNQDALNGALDALKSHGGKCYIAFMDDQGKVTEPYRNCADKELMTDKITTSANAKNGPAGESAANDPNATYRVRGNSKDVRDVLNAFE
jgi:hypothetical protein